MSEFSRIIQLRWSDLDPNFHIRHSVYYDWGAFIRVEFLNEQALTSHAMQELKFGPILFREECVFRKEIRSGDVIKMNLQLARSKQDFQDGLLGIKLQRTMEHCVLSSLLMGPG